MMAPGVCHVAAAIPLPNPQVAANRAVRCTDMVTCAVCFARRSDEQGSHSGTHGWLDATGHRNAHERYAAANNSHANAWRNGAARHDFDGADTRHSYANGNGDAGDAAGRPCGEADDLDPGSRI
jgi:hypothetical protein